jgi:Flp pilus assembly protein TadG
MRGTIFGRLRLGAKRLLRDQRGNALMLTAAAVVPVIGIVGSSIDIGRAYMAKLRLQQACDAGVLAGRRAMAAGTYGDAAQAQANKMFGANFTPAQYGANTVTFTSRRDGISDVAGTATAILPTMVMRIFGTPRFNLTVGCSAKLEISNTDVMLVLDVTGSMTTVTSDGVTRMAALKTAAKSFFTSMTSAAIGDGTLRFGIVPYSSTVNVGEILYQKDPSWLVDSVTLPSRKWNSSTSKYTYDSRPFNVSGIKNMTSTMTENTGNQGANVTAAWSGCIMERATTSFSSTSTAPSTALDMDVDSKPTSDDKTKWKPLIYKFMYPRAAKPADKPSTTGPLEVTQNNLKDSNGNLTNYQDFAFSEYSAWAACPAKASKLEKMTATDSGKWNNKIDLLQPIGGTYHDVGMLWGIRLLSAEGLFSSENATATNGRPIERHIIFMTDGAMSADMGSLTFQGQEYLDQRVSGSINTSAAELTARHNNRFLQLCEKAKSKNIKIWVIALGLPLNNNLTTCADDGRAFQTNSGQGLEDIFESIAQQISRLRLSQ